MISESDAGKLADVLGNKVEEKRRRDKERMVESRRE